MAVALRWVAAFWALFLLAGCSSVSVSTGDSREFLTAKRGDILTSGQLSMNTGLAVQIAGESPHRCHFVEVDCRELVKDSTGLSDEARLAALAELWLQQALLLEKSLAPNPVFSPSPSDPHEVELIEHQRLAAYLEVARYAYGYLFYTERPAIERVFEDRQIQVKDYYNFAVQQVTGDLFEHYRSQAVQSEDGRFEVRVNHWRIQGYLDQLRLAKGRQLPDQILAAAALNFSGVRNEFRREGLGADFVANTALPWLQDGGAQLMKQPWLETPFSPLSVLIRFDEPDLAALMQTRRALIKGYDPHRQSKVEIQDKAVPLSANYTAPYALWLANSGFASQSVLSMFGLDQSLNRPHIYLMQPYDPERRIIIMLHGLASSPEAWVNTANELMGDSRLRKKYQIWQVYYPTSVPLIINRYAIYQAIEQTLEHFDPQGQHPASQQQVLIGHSMGGVLSRLLVSHSDEQVWQEFIHKYNLDEKRSLKAEKKVKPYLVFDPLPQVTRAVFISAPHRGTPMAQGTAARWLGALVRMPVEAFNSMKDLMSYLASPDGTVPLAVKESLNSINNLSDANPFVQMTEALPIADQVTYHSIMGNKTPDLPLAESSDGIVPYRSAHLDGAASELVIPYGHSVQETAQATLEIRRILRAHLDHIDSAE